jgi:hypothetical protein
MGFAPKAFDHHEWFVSRPDGGTRRYVIDYYSAGELEFSLDVRPAVDDLSSLKARTLRLAEVMREKMARDIKREK